MTATDLQSWQPGQPLIELGPPENPAQFGWTIQPASLDDETHSPPSDVEAALEAMGYLE